MAGAWQVRLHIEVRGFRTFATRGRDQADSAWTGAAGALERHPQPAGTLRVFAGLVHFSKAPGQQAEPYKSGSHAAVGCVSEMRSCGNTPSDHLPERRERPTFADRACVNFAHRCQRVTRGPPSRGQLQRNSAPATAFGRSAVISL